MRPGAFRRSRRSAMATHPPCRQGRQPDRPLAAAGARSARDKVSGRAEYTHNLAPARHAARQECFRSCRRAWPPSSRRTPGAARARGSPASSASSPIDAGIKTVIQHPYYGPAFHDQPILAARRGCASSASRTIRGGGKADPHVAEQAVQAIYRRSTRKLPAVYDVVEAAHLAESTSTTKLKPAGSFADLQQASQGQAEEHQRRARLPSCGKVERRQGLRRGRPRVPSYTFRTQKVLHLAFEPFVQLDRRRQARLGDDLHLLARAVVRAHRDRAPARAENKVRIKVPYAAGGYGSALHQAGSAGVLAVRCWRGGP